MNLDKTIKELTNRLDVIYPSYSSSSSNNEIRHDGINYWKGKKIISAKKWNEIYEKNSIYTDNYRITLVSRKPLQYFPDDYNGPISSFGTREELKEEAQKWNKEYYELLEYRKNPTLGRMKCTKCLLSGSLDDPIFAGIEKVFARIVMKHCNSNDTVNDYSQSPKITYHCNVMNIFSCPFKSKESCKNIDEKYQTSKYPYKKEDLFALHQISFAIEQAITTFFEITKDNEIIYKVDFVNDRVQEIHTNYNGEPESWGWQGNVNEQLSKVKPISNIVIIRDEQDVYSILTNKEKLECLLQEYEKKNNHRLANEVEQLQVCCDENTHCVPNEENEKANNSNEKMMIVDKSNYKNDDTESHKGENRHSKKIEELDREQQILLKDNKETIIDFLLNNKESIKIEDLKIYEPIYKCYREKGNCHICNNISNIICINCSFNNTSYFYNNKEVWLCANHWQQHKIEKHSLQ